MKTAVYPGSFNPWHDGHSDILRKALKVFGRVIVARGVNPDKLTSDYSFESLYDFSNFGHEISKGSVEIKEFHGLLVNFVVECNASAVIRGLRNGSDLQYEQNQQYWNEDLGLIVPTVYFICDRTLSHISSSAIRAIEKVKGK